MSQVTVSPVVQSLTISETVQSLSVAAPSKTPGGPAGGDLTGAYPDPVVHKIHGKDMQSGTPTDLDMWQYHASNNRWRHRTWSQTMTDNGVTAAGLAILDDADAAAQRATLGLGTTDAPKFASVSLANDEFIQNTVNGRIDFMPAPHPSGDYGVYFDLTTNANYALIGTIDSTGALNTNAGFQFSNNLAVVQSKNLDFGNTGGLISYYSQSGANLGTWYLAPYIAGAGNGNSGSLCMVSQNGMGNANRRPVTEHANPTLYVYAAGTSSASHYLRAYHDATNATVESGAGNLILSGATGVRINGSFGFATAPTAVETGWTTFTNLTTDRSCNANATTVDELADILGTLIEALKAKGIISA